MAREGGNDRLDVLTGVVGVEGHAQVARARRGDDALVLERGDERVLVGGGDRDQWALRSGSRGVTTRPPSSSTPSASWAVRPRMCSWASATPISWTSSMPAIPA